MTEKTLTKFKGKEVEFDLKPFTYAIYHYHCKGKLVDYEEINTITHSFEVTRIKTHYDFLFDLYEVEIVNEDKRRKLEDIPLLDTSKMYSLKWNKVRFVENMKELEK